MADSHPPQATNRPVAKTRSPVERLLVWGLIGALLVAAAIEFQSRKSHQQALATLQDGLDLVDKNPSQPEVTEADVKAAVGGKKPLKTEDLTGEKTAANGAKRLEVYSWFTLNPTSKREIWVWYAAKGKNPGELATVIEVQSSETIGEGPKMAASDSGNEEGGSAGMMGPPGGMTGPPGGMGGGRGMGGPPGMMGGPGGRSGRPGAAKAADDADKADTDKPDADKPDADNPDADKPDADKPDADNPDADKPDADKPDADKPDADKPDADKPDADKPDANTTDADKASEDKTAEEKTEKTDPIDE